MNEAWLMKCVEACAQSEIAAFDKMTSTLPKRSRFSPYGSSAHSVRSFRAAFRIAQPRRVLEIGFNLGHGSMIMLALGLDWLTSVEIRRDDEVKEAARTVLKAFPGKFELINRDAVLRRRWGDYDLIFIDGGHKLKEVIDDIKIGKLLGCKHFLLDDWYPHWGPGVQPAIESENLNPFAILGNMALCELNP